MREAFHIFRKDVRALWPQIVAVLAAAALPLLVHDEEHSDRLVGIMMLARWFLVVCAIHQEKLIGDREWWLTRPHSWKALLSAKLLVIVAFIQVPLLVTDIVILMSNDLPLVWARLALRQFELAAAIVLPAVAVAAVTEGLVSFGLAVIAMLLVILYPGSHNSMRWGPLMWIPPALIIAVLFGTAVILLLWQYSRRSTVTARVTLGVVTIICSVVLMIPPGAWAIALASRPSPYAESVRLEWDKQAVPSVSPAGRDFVGLKLPIRIADLPEGMLVQPDLAQLSIDAPDGSQWSSGWRPLYWPNQWNWNDTTFAQTSFLIERATLQRIQMQRATWRLSAGLTVVGRVTTEVVSAVNRRFTLDGLGVCVQNGASTWKCQNGDLPSDQFATDEADYRYSNWLRSMSMFSFTPTPIWTTYLSSPGPIITVLRRTPIARIRRDIVEQIRLGDYLP
jgi:hypothetical protein